MIYERLIKKGLEEYAIKVDNFIDKLLEGKQPPALYNASRHIIESGGKRLRPYLVAKSCEIVGGNADDAVPYAAGLEVLHNFTLVHDDVMDNDDLRRGTPTVHTIYGIPMAIAAGDLLFSKVFEAFLKHAPGHLTNEEILKSAKMVTEATILLCEGQALDLSYPSTTDVVEADYIFMVGGKTSALFKACAQVGAIVGGATTKQIESLGKFAWDAGISFQLVDDILGVTADENKLGKPIGSDLREGKKTLIIIHALKNANSTQRELITKVLGNHNATKKDIERIILILKEVGSIDYAIKKAERYTKNSLSQLDIFTDSYAKSELQTLVKYFTFREY
jgi:geranylgeranyl diphosphate synthase type I